MLRLEGAELDGVLYLRTLAEAQAIKDRLTTASNIVVIGAGFIGLELAAVTSKLGKNVTVIEALPRCMSRAVSSIVGEFYAQAHAQWGVKLLLDSKLQKISGANGRVTGITTADGRNVAADLVLVGIGIEPNVDLAQAAGLTIANGIVVDARLATTDAKISAIGDCAAFPEPGSGKLIRLESVQNAVDQGKCVARRITGQPADYVSVPWFWSDQRDLKLQMVGLTAGCDRTSVRGDPTTRAFSVFCFHGDKLLGIESINKPADHMFGRRLLAAGATLTPEEAADLSFDLKARLSRAEQPAKQTG
jgi:3-phenylpropionate/trans-cinnamate dioxygenase ferredoxin reductase subunit